MQKEVEGTTTGGDRACGGVGGGVANFCDVAGEDGCREGHIRWIGRSSAFVDAFGC